MAYAGTCDVCGNKTKVVVASSGYGPISHAYCKDCCEKGLEPYGTMVAYISGAGRFPEDINPDYVNDVRRILPLIGKTEEQFIADCEEADKEYQEWGNGICE